MAVGTKFLDPFRGVFGVRSVCMFDGVTSELHETGYTDDMLRIETRDAFMRGQDRDDPERQIAIRCIRVGGRTTGAIGFEGLQDSALTAGPLTALAAALLERMHAFRQSQQRRRRRSDRGLPVGHSGCAGARVQNAAFHHSRGCGSAARSRFAGTQPSGNGGNSGERSSAAGQAHFPLDSHGTPGARRGQALDGTDRYRIRGGRRGGAIHADVVQPADLDG